MTAAEKGQGGMGAAVSVAHKLHLIGAGLMDRGPGVTQGRAYPLVCTVAPATEAT